MVEFKMVRQEGKFFIGSHRFVSQDSADKVMRLLEMSETQNQDRLFKDSKVKVGEKINQYIK